MDRYCHSTNVEFFPAVSRNVFSQTTESAVSLCGTGFPAATSVARRAAHDNTAKMPVPPIKQLRLNTYVSRTRRDRLFGAEVFWVFVLLMTYSIMRIRMLLIGVLPCY
jgi:hypothetical protein